MNSHRTLPILAAATLFAGPLAAQQPAEKPSPSGLNALLQKGLIEEEGNQNMEAATAAYRELAEAFDNERRLAATAIYRMAEIARKQNRRDEAVKHYQRIVTDFSTCEPMARMSRENLAALGSNAPAAPGVPVPAAGAPPPAASDELAALQATLKQSPDLINSPDEAGLCPIHRAARDGRRETVAFLLDNKVPVDTPSKHGRTALHCAAEAGHKAVAELLVERGAKVDNRVTETVLPKMEQTGTNNGNTQWRTVENGRHVEEATPLHFAIMNRRAALAEWLISKGAGVNAILKMWQITSTQELTYRTKGGQPFSPLILAANEKLFDLVDLMLSKGADPAVALIDDFFGGQEMGTLLHVAVRANNIPLIDKLLARGMPVDGTGKQTPPLFWTDSIGTLRHLLDKGAKVPGDALFRISSLQNASRLDVYKLLASKGGNVKALDAEGQSLLTAHNVATDDADQVTWLLDQGVAAETGNVSAWQVQKGKAKMLLYERVVLPKMLKEPAVTVTLGGGRAVWETIRRKSDDEPPPALAEVIDQWMKNNLWIDGNKPRTARDGQVVWKNEARPKEFDNHAISSPYIDWSALTIISAGPDGKPVRGTVKLDAATFEGAPRVLPWGTVIELALSNDGPMKKEIVDRFDTWHRIKVAVTFGDVRREFTLPIRTDWVHADTAWQLVKPLVEANPRARTGAMELKRTAAGKSVTTALPDSGDWPRIVDGDEIIIPERPLNSPATLERLKGRNLYFLPDKNQWLHGSRSLTGSLGAFISLLGDRDLAGVKVVAPDKGDGNADRLYHPEKFFFLPVDLEKAAAAWDEEASIPEIAVPQFGDGAAGQIVILPPAPEGKPGMSEKLRRMMEKTTLVPRPQPVSIVPPPGVAVPRPGASVPQPAVFPPSRPSQQPPNRARRVTP